MGDREGGSRRRRIIDRGLTASAACLAMAALMLVQAPDGHANGEDDFTIGVLTVPLCAGLRATSGPVDVILTCLEETTGGKRTCSRLVPTAEGGAALGFCADGSFGASPAPVTGGVLEANKSIRQTSFGGVTNLSVPDALSGSVLVDTFCQTFPPEGAGGGSAKGPPKASGGATPGRKFCVSFRPMAIPPGNETGHPLPVVHNQLVCDEVAARVGASVARGQRPVFVALISATLQGVAQPTELVACGTYGWERAGEPSGPSVVNGVIDLRIVDTPRLLCYNGRC